MIARNRTMAALFAGLTAGVLTLVLPVEAQVPSTAPVVKPTDTVNLTMEQRHIIKEIVKDLKIAPAPAKQDISLGTEVPSTIKLEPMPAQVSAKVPQIRSHLFFVEDSKIILVEAKDRKIVDVIE